MQIYHIKDDYINFLKQYDSKVPDNKFETRPYVGVLIEINNIKYYAPLSSPKTKHKKMKNTKDFRKINGGEYGAINLNNMIPILDTALIKFNFDDITDEKYRRLLQNQFEFINYDSDNILKTAKSLYNIIISDISSLSEFDRNIKKRCCDLQNLEKIYTQYKNE